jgi:predicted PurR-regulated permease PerM
MNNRPPTPPWAMFLVVVALVVAVWIIGRTIGQVLIVFAFSVVLALVLNPLVRVLRRARIPRGLAVAIAFVGLFLVIAIVVWLVVTPVRSQIQQIQNNLPYYHQEATTRIQELQSFLNRHGVHTNVKKGLLSFVNGLESRLTQGTTNVLSYSLGVLSVIVTILITLVASIYMVLDAPRILRVARRIGGDPTAEFLQRTEQTLLRYLRAQVLVSGLIAGAVGLVLYLFGIFGLFPLGATFAVTFMTWIFLMDFVPYVGPILGAIPPVALALLTSLTAAICVVITFVVVHETVRRVLPKAMADAAGVQPLVVIFGLLIGAQLDGVTGVVLAIPLVVIAKEAVSTFADYTVARRLAVAETTSTLPGPVEAPPPVPAAPDPSPETAPR